MRKRHKRGNKEEREREPERARERDTHTLCATVLDSCAWFTSSPAHCLGGPILRSAELWKQRRRSVQTRKQVIASFFQWQPFVVAVSVAYVYNVLSVVVGPGSLVRVPHSLAGICFTDLELQCSALLQDDYKTVPSCVCFDRHGLIRKLSMVSSRVAFLGSSISSSTRTLWRKPVCGLLSL